MNWTGGKRFY